MNLQEPLMIGDRPGTLEDGVALVTGGTVVDRRLLLLLMLE
jgi:hypothetical protein